jgi:epoxyqueuosine reductase QueG
MSISNPEQFKANPNAFLEKTIKEFAASSVYNRLPAFGNEPIFGEPLVGFANGDDTIFQQYKKEGIIGNFHLTPREVLERHIQQKEDGASKKPAKVSVISYILPITYKTRLSLRKETQVISVRWNNTRWKGQDFINELSLYLVSLLEKLGYHAIAPEQSAFYERKDLSSGLISNWSQRHIAYAAGLGTFSLSDGFITPKGLAMRCGSVVCDAALTPTPRLYENHLANCLFYSGGSCQRCIERCPSGAISQKGHDKKRCQDFLFNEQKKLLKELGRENEGYMGHYLACGLCQVKVPCEVGIPVKNE